MTKEQINYLLVLATLLIVWLYFNTFYVNAKKNYGGGPFGGVKSSLGTKLLNVPAIPKTPEAPKLADLLKGFPQAKQAPAAPVGMSAEPSEAPKMGEVSNS
jgi:hypothetical protein